MGHTWWYFTLGSRFSHHSYWVLGNYMGCWGSNQAQNLEKQVPFLLYSGLQEMGFNRKVAFKKVAFFF